MMLEICKYIPYKSWDSCIIGQLHFNNVRRAYTFIHYYTVKHDCLIRVYNEFGRFVESYRNGKQIWNGW